MGCAFRGGISCFDYFYLFFYIEVGCFCVDGDCFRGREFRR